MKRGYIIRYDFGVFPAAFRRLCVETDVIQAVWQVITDQPPSGGCVLKRKQFIRRIA